MLIIGKNFVMDRLFVANFEDKEALYKSARDKENVRSDPPRGACKSDNAVHECEQSSPVITD